jgi:rare lipoprotein A
MVHVLGACSSLRKEPQDGPPSVVDRPEIPLPADQVPRVEPLSKYGNPSSYVVFGKTYHTLPSSQGFVQRGIASWYGKKFHGRLTSSREPYDMYGMTAAHTQLPLPTYVQVTNLKNGKQVVLRVNDRGPFHGNRVIDLSYTAAMKLDIVKEGTGLVEVRALDPRNYRHAQNRTVNSSGNASVKTESVAKAAEPVDEVIAEKQVAYVEDDSAITVSAKGPQVYVQVGAFGERENANQLKNQLSSLNIGEVTISSVIKNAKQLHRVRIGPLATVRSADDTVAELNAMGMNNHRVVIE